MKSHRTTASAAAPLRWRAVIGPLFALLLLLGAAIVARPATAQEIWVERAKVIEQLDKGHAEAPVALGLTEEGAVIELFRTTDGATWTLVLTLPNGYSRVIASGKAWMSLPVAVKGQVS